MSFLIEHWQFTSSQPKRIDAYPEQLQAHHWYHCERNDPDTKAWLRKNHVPKATLEQFITNENRPSFHPLGDDNFLLLLRGINRNHSVVAKEVNSIRILFYHGALITTQTGSNDAVQRHLHSLNKHREPENLAGLVNQIIDNLNQKTDDYNDAIEASLEQQDNLPHSDNKLRMTKNSLLSVRHFLKPQLHAIHDMVTAKPSLIKLRSHQYRYSLNTLIRLNEEIDYFLEEISLHQEENKNLREQKLNQNSYLFTILAAIFLPTTFLTGLFGVNLGGMPGLKSGLSFALFSIILIIIFIIEWLVIKHFGFINKNKDRDN
ncbi:CorA family divalent cation transporter [Vibrio sp. DNB22_17_1]